MNFQYRLQSTTVALLVFQVFISGCTPPENPSPTAESTSIQPGRTSTDGTVMETEAPIEIETLIPTATASPFPSAMPLPVPTLPREEALVVVAKLLKSNDDCLLPCWWGFVPGETSWESAKPFLQSVALDIFEIHGDEWIVYYVVELAVPEDIYSTSITHGYEVHDGIIQSIEVNPGRSLILRLEEVLKTYGEPEEIWISYWNAPKMGYMGFEAFAFYPQYGFLIQYEARRASIYKEKITGCPQEDRHPHLIIWSPDDKVTFLHALDMSGTFSTEFTYLSLEDATGLDVASYYATFENNNPICIETPVDLWPPWREVN